MLQSIIKVSSAIIIIIIIIYLYFTQLQVTLHAFVKHSLSTSQPIREVCWQSEDQDAIILFLNVDDSS